MKYRVLLDVMATIVVEVEADSEEEAKEKAVDLPSYEYRTNDIEFAQLANSEPIILENK